MFGCWKLNGYDADIVDDVTTYIHIMVQVFVIYLKREREKYIAFMTWHARFEFAFMHFERLGEQCRRDCL